MARKITALKTQKRNPNRINVYLDGDFAFGISRIAGAWLEIGNELDEDRIRELQGLDAVEVGFQKAVHFLSYRPRSEREVTQNLVKHGFSEMVIVDVLDRLRQRGLADDRDFAQTWVENRSEFRPRGRRALRLELRQKGVADGVIDEVLDCVDDGFLARKAARLQARKYRYLEREEFRKKMIAYLSRRGFNYGISAEIAEETWSQNNAKLDTDEKE
jgi:regulatory protein